MKHLLEYIVESSDKEEPHFEIMKNIKKLCEKFSKPKGNKVASQLNSIAKAIADIFDENFVKIIIPYDNFNCYGSAKDIYKDTDGLMYYNKKIINKNDATTLFYNDEKIKQGSFLPFDEVDDEFYIQKGKIEEEIPTFYLKFNKK